MSTGKRESDTGTAMEGKQGLGLLRSAGKNLVKGREVKSYVESLRAGESPVTAERYANTTCQPLSDCEQRVGSLT